MQNIDLSSLPIANKDKKRILVFWIVAFMAGDIMESCVMDIEDVLARYEISSDLFDGVRDLKDVARRELRKLKAGSSFRDDEAWGYACDNVYEILRGKAKRIIKLEKEDPNWGKNNN